MKAASRGLHVGFVEGTVHIVHIVHIVHTVHKSHAH